MQARRIPKFPQGKSSGPLSGVVSKAAKTTDGIRASTGSCGSRFEPHPEATLFSHCLHASGNEKPKPKLTCPPRIAVSALLDRGPANPRESVSSVMASGFCFGFFRAGSSQSRRHGVLAGCGGGGGWRGRRADPGRAESSEAGGEPPFLEANLLTDVALPLCTCPRGTSARAWTSLSAGARCSSKGMERCTQCGVVRDTAVSWRSRFVGY